MADSTKEIGPASNSLTAFFAGKKTAQAPKEHQAVEKTEGVVPVPTTPSVVFETGDIVRDTDNWCSVTIVKPSIGKSNEGTALHEVINAKSGMRYIQCETKLKKSK